VVNPGRTPAELLDTPLRDLGLTVSGTSLERDVERLHRELADRGIRHRPHVWISTDWFSPHGVPGIAVPFWAADARLARLIRAQGLETEGATGQDRMRHLRHEAAHAFDTAHRLHHRRAWRDVFGRAGLPYRRHYRARPSRAEFVRYLPRWYAQSHPVEDFAESFAVWLDPGRDAAAVPSAAARAKVDAVAELVDQHAARAAPVRSRERTEAVTGMRETLGAWLRRRRTAERRHAAPAWRAKLLRHCHADGDEPVASWLTRRAGALHRGARREIDADRYSIDQVLYGMLHHARANRLRLARRPSPGLESSLARLVARTLRRLERGEELLTR
jgi:hypothetical protein